MTQRAPDVSMLFFGEGTRSRDGQMHAFKMGAFATAIAEGLPVLPVAVAGTFQVWPKGALRLRRAPVVVEVGDPISVDGLTLDDRATLRDTTWRAVARLRERARGRLGLARGRTTNRSCTSSCESSAEPGQIGPMI